MVIEDVFTVASGMSYLLLNLPWTVQICICIMNNQNEYLTICRKPWIRENFLPLFTCQNSFAFYIWFTNFSKHGLKKAILQMVFPKGLDKKIKHCTSRLHWYLKETGDDELKGLILWLKTNFTLFAISFITVKIKYKNILW